MSWENNSVSIYSCRRVLRCVVSVYIILVLYTISTYYEQNGFETSYRVRKAGGQRNMLEAKESTGTDGRRSYSSERSKQYNKTDDSSSKHRYLDYNVTKQKLTTISHSSRDHLMNRDDTKDNTARRREGYIMTFNQNEDGNNKDTYIYENKIPTKTALISNKTNKTHAINAKERREQSQFPTLSEKRDLYFAASGNTGSDTRFKLNQTLKSLQNNFQFENVDFTLYALNATASQRIPFERNVPETRLPECIRQVFSESLPSVTIIIPFHNEQYSMLLRSLHSIINKTPQHLIHEILLIDDASTHPNLGHPLEEYVKALPRVSLYRTRQREGLIRARLLGSLLATADYIVFLDAHIECQRDWLQPLLQLVLKEPLSIAIPAIDRIDPETISYSNVHDYTKADSRYVTGIFDWELNYVWVMDPYPNPNQSPLEPVISATLIGCAIAMRRDTFFNMGAFDEGMYIWGGENLELSFRTWMCGGAIRLVPCSKIGHVFRQKLPYKFPNIDQVQKNLQRVAEVWMDDYRHLFYRTTGRQVPFTPSEHASLEARHQLRREKGCKNFQWYMDMLGLKLPIPYNDDRYFGKLEAGGLPGGCLTLLGGQLGLYDCMYHSADQLFHLSWDGWLRHAGGHCVTADVHTRHVFLRDCQPDSKLQQWGFNNGEETEKRPLYTGQRQSPGRIILRQSEDSLRHTADEEYCLSFTTDYILENGERHIAPFVKNCLDNGGGGDELLWLFSHHLYT